MCIQNNTNDINREARRTIRQQVKDFVGSGCEIQVLPAYYEIDKKANKNRAPRDVQWHERTTRGKKK